MRTYKKAFTMVELLITLTVIGVLLSLIIPTFMGNFNKTIMYESFRGSYKNISQVFEIIKAKNRNTLVNVFTDSNSMLNAFCNETDCVRTCQQGTANGNCWHSSNSNIKTLDLSHNGWFATSSAAVLSNGSFILFTFMTASCNDSRQVVNGQNSLCDFIVIDTNGFKSPNIVGRDIFTFNLASQGLFPGGGSGSQTDIGVNGLIKCSMTSTDLNNGDSCAARLIQEGGMNY